MKTLKATIEFKPGSEWQEEVAWSNLELILTAWKSFYEEEHKKNEIDIGMDKNE